MNPNPAIRYTGEVVYIYAFDVAYDTARKPVRELLGQPMAQFVVDTSRRSPRQLFFYRPQMVRLPPMERIGPLGPVRVERAIKLLPVGAISITVRVPFAVGQVEELVAFHDLQFSNGALYDEVRQLAQHVVAELRGHLIRPQPKLPEEEAYTVFCLASPVSEAGQPPLTAEQWFQAHRRPIAALLTQEETGRLSKQEAEESTARYLSYYDNDLVVIDWDAALLVDEPADFDESLYIMELANLQLAELEAYDRLLDDALERSYRDLGERPLRLQSSGTGNRSKGSRKYHRGNPATNTRRPANYTTENKTMNPDHQQTNYDVALAITPALPETDELELELLRSLRVDGGAIIPDTIKALDAMRVPLERLNDHRGVNDIEIIAKFLRIITNQNTALQAGQRVYALAYLLGISNLQTQRELARQLNVSSGRVTQILQAFPIELRSLCRLKGRTAKRGAISG